MTLHGNSAVPPLWAVTSLTGPITISSAILSLLIVATALLALDSFCCFPWHSKKPKFLNTLLSDWASTDPHISHQ